MGRIASAFKRLGKVGEAALIPYVAVGYPSLDITRQLVPVIARQGADLIELGIALSEPLAGGPPAGKAPQSERSVSLDDCLSVAAEARRANEIPLLFTTYYDLIRDYDLRQFAFDCAASGIDGLVVPDLPPEEADTLKAMCDSAGVDFVITVTPTSTDRHLKRLAEMASGFIYCASLHDVPHITNGLLEASELVSRLRRHTDLPVAVGFGISTPEQVAEAIQFADAIVIGSALTDVIEGLDEEEIIGGVAEYVRALKEATVRPTET